MIKIVWNNLYQYSYPIELLINNSDYFNSMFNNIYLDNHLDVINIQLPNHITIDKTIMEHFNLILTNWNNLQLIDTKQLNYHTLLSITYILSYIQMDNITNLITYLNKLVQHAISVEIDTPNNIIYEWFIYYHLEDFNNCSKILSNYSCQTIKTIIGNILNYSYNNPNYLDLIDVLYNIILDIAPILVSDIDLSNLFCLDSNIANQFLDTISTNNIDKRNLLSHSTFTSTLPIDEPSLIAKIHYLTNNLFLNIPWELDILISGNLLVLLFLEKITVETYSLDFYIDNKPSKIKLLMDYIYQCIGNENYTIILDNMISIFSTTINFHINIHYTNYHTPLQLLYNFHFDYQEVFFSSNHFYFTTNFIKTIKTGITHIKSSIQLFDLFYTLSIPFSIYNCSLNYLKTNYKIDREKLDKNYLEKIPTIREQKYGYFLPQTNYNVDKNKYELMRVYQVDKVYYHQELVDIVNTITIDKTEIILEYCASYTQGNAKIDKYNIFKYNYKIHTYSLQNMKLVSINEKAACSLKSTKYRIEIQLNENNHKHLDLYNKIDNLRLELVNILKTNLAKKIKTIISNKDNLVLYLNHSTKIYDYHRKMITIDDLIKITNKHQIITMNGLFEIEYMTLILDTIYIKKYLKELYILDDIYSN